MKIVSDKKITKFPKASTSVRACLRRAMHRSEIERWKSVIIIGEGPEGICDYRSPMDLLRAVGLLDLVKADTLNELR